MKGDVDDDGGIPHGRLLIHFAEAVLAEDEGGLQKARQQVRQAMGDAALVDAAAVIASFNSIDRIADATGIPLERSKADDTADFRQALDINHFSVTAR